MACTSRRLMASDTCRPSWTSCSLLGPAQWEGPRPGPLSCDSPMETAERAIRPAADWRPAGDYEDIRYELADGIAKLTIARPEVHNAFRPETLIELSDALDRAREDTDVGVV